MVLLSFSQFNISKNYTQDKNHVKTGFETKYQNNEKNRQRPILRLSIRIMEKIGFEIKYQNNSKKIDGHIVKYN